MTVDKNVMIPPPGQGACPGLDPGGYRGDTGGVRITNNEYGL